MKKKKYRNEKGGGKRGEATRRETQEGDGGGGQKRKRERERERRRGL